MKQYIDALRTVLERGEERPAERNSTPTVSYFGGINMEFDLQAGFPAVTTKKLFWKGVVHELLWFLRGEEHVRYLREHGVRIWDGDARGEYVGPIYGVQWRRWAGRDGGRPVDQIANVIRSIRECPLSRRHVVSAWNVADLPDMVLAPCHVLFQFYVRSGKFLDCKMYQRSADMFLGVPFNIASYSLLTHMVAHVTGLQAGRFYHSIGDAHIYVNHLNQVDEQIKRDPLPLPTLWLDASITHIDDFRAEHIRLEGYQSHPPIYGELST